LSGFQLIDTVDRPMSAIREHVGAHTREKRFKVRRHSYVLGCEILRPEHAAKPVKAPRRPNRIRNAASITIWPTPGIVRYLNALVDTELFGKTPPEVVMSLLRESIRRLQSEGTLRRRSGL
jgi:hypothetical protein